MHFQWEYHPWGGENWFWGKPYMYISHFLYPLMDIWRYLQESDYISSVKYPDVGLLKHMVAPPLIFWGTSILFSIKAVPVHTLTKCAERFFFSTFLLTLVSCLFFIIVILKGMRWFWFAFPLLLVMLRTFSCTCWLFGCHLYKNVYSGFWHIFK